MLGPVLLLFFAQPPAGDLPKVLLLGDSIRLGYAPLVAKELAGVADVLSPKENGGDSDTTLKKLDQWVGDAKPAVVHWNNGLHDLKKLKADGTFQVPVEKYSENLRAVAAKLTALTPHVVFANTTPIVDDRHAKRKANFDRFDGDVVRYNAAAEKTILDVGLPVHDLYRVVADAGPGQMLGADGTHYTPAGYARLAAAVADSVKRQLAVARPTRLKPPASGPDAAAAYAKAEADRDAGVPDSFRTFTSPPFPAPKSADDWAARRPDVKAKVVASLGDLPPRPAKPKPRLVSAERRPGFRIERFLLDNGLDGEMSAMLLVPDNLTGPAPAVLWLHSSSFDHRQLLVPDSNGGPTPLGLEFVKRGWVVFAPDAAWYGDRGGRGPSGPAEKTTEQQASQSKFHLMFGRTLWGTFVRDDQCALDYLVSRPEVDPKRVAATGISMGSTRSWWLAAVDDRIACVACVSCLTRYENLIRHGQLRQHGVYYFPFGLLKHFDTEAVLALIAPRPALFLTGDLDAGSPADGVRALEAKAGGVYDALAAKGKFRSVLYEGVGHTYTPAMRAEVLQWFETHLK